MILIHEIERMSIFKSDLEYKTHNQKEEAHKDQI